MIRFIHYIDCNDKNLQYTSWQVMDDRWETEISEFGAINITGFRIVDEKRSFVRDFLDGWKRLDPDTSVGAGKETISVRIFFCVCIVDAYLG